MLWLLCSFVACVLHFYLPCTSCGWVPPDHRLFCLQGLSSSLLLVLADFCLLEKKIHKILPKDFHIGWYYLFLLSTFWVEKNWKMCFFQPNNCHFWIDYWLRSLRFRACIGVTLQKAHQQNFFHFHVFPWYPMNIYTTSVACAVGTHVTTSSTDFSFPKPDFLEFIWIFSARNHLKINNVSHILNANFTK